MHLTAVIGKGCSSASVHGRDSAHQSANQCGATLTTGVNSFVASVSRNNTPPIGLCVGEPVGWYGCSRLLVLETVHQFRWQYAALVFEPAPQAGCLFGLAQLRLIIVASESPLSQCFVERDSAGD